MYEYSNVGGNRDFKNENNYTIDVIKNMPSDK